MLASPPCERLEQARTAKFARYYRNNIFLPLLSSPIRACFFWFFCFASRASDFVVVVWEQIFLPVITPKANTILNHAKYHRIAVLILNCSQPYYSFYLFIYLFIYLFTYYLFIGDIIQLQVKKSHSTERLQQEQKVRVEEHQPPKHWLRSAIQKSWESAPPWWVIRMHENRG